MSGREHEHAPTLVDNAGGRLALVTTLLVNTAIFAVEGRPVTRWLTRRDDHCHKPAFHLRKLFNFGHFIDLVADFFQNTHAKVLVRHLSPAETQGHLDLVAFIDETNDRPHFDVVIMIIDARTHLDLLDLDYLLFFAGCIRFFLRLVLELAVVKQLADWWA